MSIEELRGLVEKRRSTRGYDESRKISDEALHSILDCAAGRRRAATASLGNLSSFAIRRPATGSPTII